MTRYLVQQLTNKPVDLRDDQIITITEAARLLSVTRTTVSQALNRGAFTVVVDSQAANPQKGRRLLLRAEVEARAAGVDNYRLEVSPTGEPTPAEPVQYVMGPDGRHTAVLVPLALWKTLLDAAGRHIEDQEDTARVQDWLTRRRAAGSPADMDAVPWEE